jgi:hypothetical protein
VAVNVDYTEMFLIYGEARMNAGEVWCLYQQRFPNKRQAVDTVSKIGEAFA